MEYENQDTSTPGADSGGGDANTPNAPDATTPDADDTPDVDIPDADAAADATDPDPEPTACGRRVAVTFEDDAIDCGDPGHYCVGAGRAYDTIQAAVDAAQADGAAGRVVAVFGTQDGAPIEFDGFVVEGDGSGAGGGAGDALSERFVVKAVGGVLLTRRAAGSIDAPILVADVDYVTVDGFDVDRTSTPGSVTLNYDHAGVRVTDTNWRNSRTSRGVHLVNLSVRRGSPANLYVANVSDVVIEGSVFEESVISEQYRLGGGIHVYLSNEPVDRATVRCNRFEDSVGMSIHTNGDGGLIEGNLYEYNVFRTSVGHAMHFQDGRDMIVRNNVFVDVDRSAVTAWGSASDFAPRGFSVYNNLFLRTTRGQSSPSPVQIGTEGRPQSDGDHTIFNNLFVGNGQGNDVTVRGDGAFTLEHNLDEQGGAVTTDGAPGSTAMEDLFVDFAGGDFRFALEPQRAAVRGAGARRVTSPGGSDVVVPEHDLLGEARGEDNVSVGPYEY